MSRTILVVEDNKLNMKLFRDLLEIEGHRVIALESGDSAVESARRNRPDLIIMDIRLPGESGSAIAQKIKNEEELKHVPILAVTAYATAEEEAEIRAHGCDAYLAKPISIENFLAAVRACL